MSTPGSPTPAVLFIRNERWNEADKLWVPFAGQRMPDNRANRRKLGRDLDACRISGMRVRLVQYEIKEVICEVIVQPDPPDPSTE